MLTELLRIIYGGNLRTQHDIAQLMGISPALVSMMANQLVHQGYLEEINPGCSCTDELPQKDEGPCSDCPTKKVCGFDPTHLWTITEKGKRAISI